MKRYLMARGVRGQATLQHTTHPTEPRMTLCGRSTVGWSVVWTNTFFSLIHCQSCQRKSRA